MSAPRRLRITVDTNVVPVEPVLHAARGLQVDVVITTVTAREMGSKWEPELSMLRVIPETWVMGESPLGVAALGSTSDAQLFEKTLTAISNGSFPQPGDRGRLTAGQQRQLRDAMIFCTHVRERRDIFITNDVTAFGDEATVQRRRFDEMATTRIMTLTEFERFCAARRPQGWP